MFESGNRLQSQLIGACLEVFQTVESKICYTKHVLRALRISVGPLLYLLIGFDVLDLKKLGQMYADILERARVCLQLCLDRIKKKEQMLIMLLQELLEPISNDSPTAVQCNLLMFAVLVDIWSTFECENSNLHCKAVN